MSDLTIRIAPGLTNVAGAAWDACANPATPAASSSPAPGPSVDSAEGERRETYNPFVSYAFLSALEDSGCVSARTGWLPLHVLVQRGTDLLAAAPCYLKTHSQGEYVFDHAWADAYERAGGRYYPKLQVCVPFTPVTGPRLLLAGPEQAREMRAALIEGLRAVRAQTKASSIHLTFMLQDEAEDVRELGLLRRLDQQFHWLNEGYGSFDAFLAALASRKRKAIRRERRDALAGGEIAIEWITGRDITEAHWDAFFAFYMDTGSRKWGRPYLNRRFFSLIGERMPERMPERVLLIMAKRGGRYIAGALNLIGDAALYGRNWGCVEDHPFLHFEICYYQAIDFAISRRLARVEAGAQGEHKLARGYRPALTYSAHDIADPSLRHAVEANLSREQDYVVEAAEELAEATPFRKIAEG